MTGYTETAASLQAFLGERMDMLLKPFPPRELLRKVRSILDAEALQTPV